MPSPPEGPEAGITSRSLRIRSATPQFADIVYRTSFAYDPLTDAITFWYSGARYSGGRYVWSAAVERRRRTDVFAPATRAAQSAPFPPAPAPLVDWP
jgi:hypothetical protein